MQKKRRMTRLIAVPAYALCLAAFISFLPAAVLTARAESETPTTGSGTAEDPYVVFNWAELKSKMAEGGFITLGEDAVDPDRNSESYLYVPQDITVVLDLNGHTINRGLTEAVNNGSVIMVEKGNLTVRDTSSEECGCIIGGNSTYSAGGINVSYGVLSIEGGNIIGNHSKSRGGGICLFEGSSGSMTGGAVSANEAEGYGGGIYTAANTFDMSGGIVTENTSQGLGGGVYVGGDDHIFNMSGTAEVTNNNGSRGGGISTWESETTINISGGLISGNTAVGDGSWAIGGGVFVGYDGMVNISGGTITGNSTSAASMYAKEMGGGVWKGGDGSISITGAPVITGNTSQGQNSNVCLEGTTILIPGALAEGAVIGVTNMTLPTETVPVILTSGYKTYNESVQPNAYFIPDNLDYEIIQGVDGEAYLAIAKKYKMALAGVYVTPKNADDLTVIDGVSVADGGYVKYDAETNTLKIKDATIRGVNNSDGPSYGIAYEEDGDFTIEAEGTNVVQGATSSNDLSAGLLISCNANATITIPSGASLTVLGGEESLGESGGICKMGDGDFSVHSDGALIAKGGKARNSFGFLSYGKVMFDGTGTVEIGNSEGTNGYGLYAGNVEMNSGIIAITIVDSSKQAYGIYTDSMIMNGGEITVSNADTSEEINSLSIGLFTTSFTMNDGTAQFYAGDAARSYGMMVEKKILLNGGALETSTQMTNQDSGAITVKPELPVNGKAYASVNPDGSNPEEFDAEKTKSYKWFCYPYGEELKNEDGRWVYYRNGRKDSSFYGFVDYDGSKFIVANGAVVSSKNGLVQDPNDKDVWYFCAGGKVVTNKSGLVQYPAKEDKWFIVENGKLDTTYSGFVDYNGGKFFVARGKLVRKDGLVQDPNKKADWYFLSKGQVQKQKTGVVIYNKAGFYVVKGKLDTSYNGKATYNGKSVNIVNGRMK